jgi:hypothetical protein
MSKWRSYTRLVHPTSLPSYVSSKPLFPTSIPSCASRSSSHRHHHISLHIPFIIVALSISIFLALLSLSAQPSTMSLSTLILSIMTSRPIVTMMSSVKLNQPMTMALDPTPLSTAPLPKSWAIMLAATEAVCCHSTDTRTKIDAMKMMASATWETGRDGNGFTSRSEPSESSSSCQPGKVARRRRQMKAKMMAMMLPWC